MESKIVIKLKIKGQWVELTKSEFIQLRAEIEEITRNPVVEIPIVVREELKG